MYYRTEKYSLLRKIKSKYIINQMDFINTTSPFLLMKIRKDTGAIEQLTFH